MWWCCGQKRVQSIGPLRKRGYEVGEATRRLRDIPHSFEAKIGLTPLRCPLRSSNVYLAAARLFDVETC